MTVRRSLGVAACVVIAACSEPGSPPAPTPVPTPVPTAAGINATLAAAARPTPLIGFNTNAHHSIANWTLPWFRDSTATLNSAVLRYPGGTTANHWDWQTGWFQLAPTTPAQFANITPRGTIRFEELQLGLLAAAAAPLLVLNIQHATLAYELQGLARAVAVGVPVTLVELGNEHNLTGFQSMDPAVYASRVKLWADSIKAAFPGVKVCAVGGTPPNLPQWHDVIFSQSPRIDALAFHLYLGAGNTDGAFNVTRALSIPFAASGGLVDRYNRAGFNQPSIPANIEVWATEYNLGEALSGAAMQHADTWTHALYASAMSHLLLGIPRVTMLINHNLTNTLDFAAIDPFTRRITANGVAMMLLGQASKGLPNATEIMFPNSASVTYMGTSYPSLIGWRFSSASVQRAWIVNLSGSAQIVSFANVLNGSFSYRLLHGDPALHVNGAASLLTTAGQSGGSITLPAYSIGVLERGE